MCIIVRIQKNKCNIIIHMQNNYTKWRAREHKQYNYVYYNILQTCLYKYIYMYLCLF